MTDTFTLHLSSKTRNVLIGKFILVLILSIALGYIYESESRADNLKADTITIEEYTAAFNEYRAELRSVEFPLWANFALISLFLLLFASFYEALSLFIGWLIGKVLVVIHSPESPVQSDAT